MIDQVPQCCRFVVYSFLQARDLYRLCGTCKSTQDATDSSSLWQHLFEIDLLTLHDHETNHYDFYIQQYVLTVRSVRLSCGIDSAEERKWNISPMRWTTWSLMYRACAKKLLSLATDVMRLQKEMNLVQSLRRERGHLKDLTQIKGKRTGAEIRRNQLSCVKYLNKTSRRMMAFEHQNTSSVSKSELMQQLNQIDSSIKDASAAAFTLRNQMRKEYRKVLGFLAAAVAKLHSFDTGELNRAPQVV